MGATPVKGVSAAESDGASFRAFLSYSHADAPTVKKLHSKIEAYRLPKSLGTLSALNRQNGRLGRVFRDREDFSAAHDLSEAVTDALDRSQVLIVVCSPDAKASRWVNEEIRYFKDKHPDRPILTAIVRGDPEDVIPASLLEGGVEPLAADLRKEGDGWRLGFLKVVAGVAGVPLDALIERDSQRQMRRVMAVTGLVALVALAMGVMTSVAIQARSEAEFQRDQAEGLIAYLMGELRTELKGVGRLDVMKGVNQRALQFYSNQGEVSNLQPDSLEQRAIVLHGMGEDFELAGDLDTSLERFAEAHRDTGELLRREPNNPDRIYAHAQSEYWVGFAAWRQVKPELAQPHWRNYANLSEQLLEQDGENVDWVMEAGYAKSNLGTLALRGEGDNAKAARLFEEAIGYFRRAAELSPNNPDIEVEIADAHGWIADAYRAERDPISALKERKTQRAILEKIIRKDPKNAFFQSELIGNAVGTAQALFDSGDVDQAIMELQAVRTMVKGQIATSPDNESLRLQESAISLLIARADEGVGAESQQALRGCIDDTTIQSEPELRAFCSYLRTKFGLQPKGEAEKFESPFPKMRLTPRWGLEL